MAKKKLTSTKAKKKLMSAEELTKLQKSKKWSMSIGKKYKQRFQDKKTGLPGGKDYIRTVVLSEEFRGGNKNVIAHTKNDEIEESIIACGSNQQGFRHEKREYIETKVTSLIPQDPIILINIALANLFMLLCLQNDIRDYVEIQSMYVNQSF